LWLVTPYDEDTTPNLHNGIIDVYPGSVFEVSLYAVDTFGQRLSGKHAIIPVTPSVDDDNHPDVVSCAKCIPTTHVLDNGKVTFVNIGVWHSFSHI
jgi:hypothetical protein